MYRALVIAAAIMVSGCGGDVNDPRVTEAEIQAALKKSADVKRPGRQNMMDEASVVCRDGWAYLAGDDHNTHRVRRRGAGGPFVTPYMRNGVQGRCGNNATTTWDKEERR